MPTLPWVCVFGASLRKVQLSLTCAAKVFPKRIGHQPAQEGVAGMLQKGWVVPLGICLLRATLSWIPALRTTLSCISVFRTTVCRDSAWARAGRPGGSVRDQPSHTFPHSGQPSAEIRRGHSQVPPNFPKKPRLRTLVKTCTRKLTKSILELWLRRSTLG